MSTNRPEILSFEVTRGEKSGDLLSNRRGDKKLKVGLLTCAYFEYWRMYEGLQEQVRGDLQTIADRIGGRFDVVYPAWWIPWTWRTRRAGSSSRRPSTSW